MTSQGRFNVPPDDPFFWGDYPFGIEAEERRREEEENADTSPSWIQETQERRRREREEKG